MIEIIRLPGNKWLPWYWAHLVNMDAGPELRQATMRKDHHRGGYKVAGVSG